MKAPAAIALAFLLVGTAHAQQQPTAQPPERTAETVDSDTRIFLVDALRALPADQRAVLVLRFYEDLSEAQTADLLRVPVGTVKSRTTRALQALRQSGIALVEEAEP